MARQARIISKNNYYHILMRGNNRAYIFENNIEKQIFWNKLCELELEQDIQLAAWCIMDNHAHLVAKIEPEKISKAMKRLNTSFAMHYHRINHSIGHVFQGRYKSVPIESEPSLMNVIRYVHNNPVKANMIKHINEYKWSSYQNYLAGPKNDIMEFIWQLFDKNEKKYIDFHQEEDYREYLEIKEDQYKIRQDYVYKIINDVCRKNKMSASIEAYQNPLILTEIITCVNSKINISNRKLAEIIGTKEYTIRKIKNKLLNP